MAVATEKQQTIAEMFQTDFLKCKQCHEFFHSPILLPCLHVYCAKCIAALPQTELPGSSPEGDTAEGSTTKQIQLKCPLCEAQVTIPDTLSKTPFFLKSLCQLYSFKHKSNRMCSYCEFDGKGGRPAESLCLDCVDDMCEPCATAHRKTRVTRNHIQAPYDQIKNGMFDDDIRACQVALCQLHNLELILFCIDCGQLACRSCLPEIHMGHSLQTMETAINKLEPELNSFAQKLNGRVFAMNSYQKYLLGYLEGLEGQKKDLTERVMQQAQGIHDLVDQCRDSLLYTLTSTLAEEENQISSRSRQVYQTIQSLESNTMFLSGLLSVGTPAEVLQLHPIIMDRFKQLLQMSCDSMRQRLTLNFHPQRTRKENMCEMLGTLTIQETPVDKDEICPNASLSLSALLPPLMDPPRMVCSVKIKQDVDRKLAWPSGLYVRKEKLAIVDKENRKIKIFDCNSVPPTLRFQIRGKEGNKLMSPFDVVLLENGNVVVSDQGDKKVKVFHIGGRWIRDLEGEFKLPRGLTLNSLGQLIVVDGYTKQLKIYDPNTGVLLKTFPDPNSTEFVLVNPFYVQTTEKDHILVSDHAVSSIKELDSHGRLVAFYGISNTSILEVYGLCLDKFGHIFLADCNNNRVQMFRPDGSFSQFLLAEHNTISHPVNVAINKENQLVVCEAYGNIKIFKYLNVEA